MTGTENLRAMQRRVVTVNNAQGKSEILIDGSAAAVFSPSGGEGMYEVWSETVLGQIALGPIVDAASGPVRLSAPKNGVLARWFIVEPRPDNLTEEELRAMTKAMAAELGGADMQPDTSRHYGMHLTPTLDFSIVLSGRIKLILDTTETILEPGSVVVQRATNHAWEAMDGLPAMILAVLIDRSAE